MNIYINPYISVKDILVFSSQKDFRNRQTKTETTFLYSLLICSQLRFHIISVLLTFHHVFMYSIFCVKFCDIFYFCNKSLFMLYFEFLLLNRFRSRGSEWRLEKELTGKGIYGLEVIVDQWFSECVIPQGCTGSYARFLCVHATVRVWSRSVVLLYQRSSFW